jgi:rhodanese-related sulfurtransferase
MRNLSLEAVQFTHKINWTKDRFQPCAIPVHAPFWCKRSPSHCFGAHCTVCRRYFASALITEQENTMSTTEQILDEARTRAPGQPYAGAVTPQEAYALLQAAPNVKLVDVRTNAERDWVGRVAVPEAQHASVQWSLYPGGVPNPDFPDQLAALAGKDDVLLFLCRSGVRSRHAAKLATEHGYTQCYDILEGFEGDKDAEGHRKQVGGWCKAGLPWLGA